ncbi:hypothetical protein [Parasitella parasitica]|uniref:Uncharacterized protein n=1 Tax=Parasitella parasitica TaxID=35722 RepID=A0A0B7NPY7_9FUNG|nr:hypothetical protein [Parasitella parasitica]
MALQEYQPYTILHKKVVFSKDEDALSRIADEYMVQPGIIASSNLVANKPNTCMQVSASNIERLAKAGMKISKEWETIYYIPTFCL